MSTSHESESIHPIDEALREKATHDMSGVALMQEVGYQPDVINETTIAEISPEIAATYEAKRDDVKYAVGCGDDREETAESHGRQVEQGSETVREYIRYYGGLSGVTKVLATAIAAQYGGETLSKYSASFVDFAGEVKQRVESASNVTLEMHSAESNEGDARDFHPEAEAGLGCAYAANIGLVANIGADTAVEKTDFAAREDAVLFGDSSRLSTIQEASHAVGTHFFGENYAGEGKLTRGDYQTLDCPVQVLKGVHADPKDTFVVINFEADRVSNPAKAAEQGHKFYNNDVTQVAEMLIKGFPELKLQPAILLAAMTQDIRATRTALAGGNPADLELRRNGDAQAAIAYLESLAA